MPRPSIDKVALRFWSFMENITIFMITRCQRIGHAHHLLATFASLYKLFICLSKTPAAPSPKRTAEERSCQSRSFEVFHPITMPAAFRTNKIFSCGQCINKPATGSCYIKAIACLGSKFSLNLTSDRRRSASGDIVATIIKSKSTGSIAAFINQFFCNQRAHISEVFSVSAMWRCLIPVRD